MRRRIWMAMTVAFVALAGWMAFLHFEPRLFPIRDNEPLIRVSEWSAQLYVSSRGLVVEGDWSPEGEFDVAGMALVSRGREGYGWIDRKGALVIPQTWKWATDFDSHGMARVRDEQGFGWIDRRGQVVLAPEWERARDFDARGWASVRRGEKWGWIDRTGNVVLPLRWSFAFPFDKCGLAAVSSEGGYSLIDRAGREHPKLLDEDESRLIYNQLNLERVLDRETTRDHWCRIGELEEPTNTPLAHGFLCSQYYRHPLVVAAGKIWVAGARRLPEWPPFDGLTLVYSPSGAIIWRSDLHYFRFLLLHAAGVLLLLASFSYWRYRVHRRRVS